MQRQGIRIAVTILPLLQSGLRRAGGGGKANRDLGQRDGLGGADIDHSGQVIRLASLSNASAASSA